VIVVWCIPSPALSDGIWSGVAIQVPAYTVFYHGVCPRSHKKAVCRSWIKWLSPDSKSLDLVFVRRYSAGAKAFLLPICCRLCSLHLPILMRINEKGKGPYQTTSWGIRIRRSGRTAVNITKSLVVQKRHEYQRWRLWSRLSCPRNRSEDSLARWSQDIWGRCEGTRLWKKRTMLWERYSSR
jgi:hypothetical protein